MKEIGQLVLSKRDIELNKIQKITELHEEIKSLMINSLEKAFIIGQLLEEQKKELPHGEFITWIETNLPFGDRTARNYITVYKNKDILKRKAVSDLNNAYLFLREETKQSRQLKTEEWYELAKITLKNVIDDIKKDILNEDNTEQQHEACKQWYESANIELKKDIPDKEEAIRTYIRLEKESSELFNLYSEIHLRCERKVGQFLNELKEVHNIDYEDLRGIDLNQLLKEISELQEVK